MFSFIDQLSLRFGNTLPVILQTEASECGLACLAMIASYHGYRSDLASLRRRYPVSLKGATLASLIDVAHRLELATRAVRLEIEDLPKLKLPCVLHWSFNHFVVLKSVNSRFVTIIDPARGERKVSYNELSDSFTGVALELWPDTGFRPQEQKQLVRLRDLMGRVTGLHKSLGQIVLLAMALEVFAMVSPFFMQWVIDNVLVSGDRDLLTTLALGFGLLVILQQAVTAIRAWVIMYLGTTLNIQWRANVFTHMLRLPTSYFEKRHMGDVVSRFNSIDTIQRTLTTSFIEAFLDGIMTIVTVVMILIYSPTLALISIGAMCLYALGRWVWYRPLRTATEEQIVHAAKQQSHFMETVRGIRTIKLFHRHNERRSSWLTLLVDQINADLQTQKLLLFFRILDGLLFGLENVVVIWLGAKLVLDASFSVGMLMAFISYKSQFATRVSSLIDKFVQVKMLQLQGERLADIVLTKPESALSEGRMVLSDESCVQSNIEIRDLRFRYAEHEPYVLDGINLTIGAGESVAIIGSSGCGKTTLMHVMLGVHAPTEGEVMVGGTNITHLGMETVRNMVGTVTQDDTLFEGSLSDNISFFDSGADQEWVETCAKLASIHDDIVAMPMGYNTFVGYMGSVLSGGQKQRLLLARALYKRPKILFLDEATSHLDVQKESIVNSAIRSLSITRVIVAHRPQTIESADRIIRLENGKVVDTRCMAPVINAASHNNLVAQVTGVEPELEEGVT